MRYIAIVLLLVVGNFAWALDYLPGSGNQVIPVQREYTFAYHSGTDDYHFYGTTTWAVRFNFREVYPSITSSEFAVDEALLYFPNIGDSVRVELFSEISGMPGVSLTWAKVPVDSNNLAIPFPETVQNDTLWMVVTYTTNFTNRFVSASSGGGSHSYYWNTNAQTPYFQSLSNAGYEAELLFGLGGEFVLSGTDLELVEFDLSGTIEPRSTVGPAFKIYNHTDQTIADAVFKLNVYSPDPEFALVDSISITEGIPPHSTYTFNSESPGFMEHAFDLPAIPMQIKLRAALSSGLTTDPQANNVILINRFSFDHTYPVYLAENFMRWENEALITTIQDQLQFPDLHVLNYFPILSDTLGNVAAQVRFNWYGYNSLPRTTINGDLRINGFSTEFADQFEQFSHEGRTAKSLISESDCRFNYNQQNDLISSSLTLTNANTLLYTSATEYNLLSHVRLFVGLFRKENFNNADRFTIFRWLYHASPLAGTLNSGESLVTEFNILLNNLSLAELASEFRVYYWLQLDDGGAILYSSWSDFTNVVSNTDQESSGLQVQISSNPLESGSTMRISLTNNTAIHRLAIYNIKGQRIHELGTNKSQYNLTSDIFPSSGIYILKVDYKYVGRDYSVYRKINIIK